MPHGVGGKRRQDAERASGATSPGRPEGAERRGCARRALLSFGSVEASSLRGATGRTAVQPKRGDSPKRVCRQRYCSAAVSRRAGTLDGFVLTAAPTPARRRCASPCWRRSRGGRRPATTGRGSCSPRCSPRAWSTRGHDVTLFATADSRDHRDAARRRSARGWSEDADDRPQGRRVHCTSPRCSSAPTSSTSSTTASTSCRSPTARLVDTPVVTTIHGFSSPRIVPVYERYDATTTLRRDQRRRPPPAPALRRHDPPRHRRRRLRACTRRPATTCSSSAASIPTRAPRTPSRSPGVPVGGSSSPASSRTSSTSASEVEPHLDGDRVRYVGPVDAADRARGARRCARPAAPHRLRRAVRLQRRRGAWRAARRSSPTTGARWPELIDDGVTGLLVGDVVDAVRAVDLIAGLDRAAIRASTVVRFDRAVMVERYAALYEAILSGGAPPPGRTQA